MERKGHGNKDLSDTKLMALLLSVADLTPAERVRATDLGEALLLGESEDLSAPVRDWAVNICKRAGLLGVDKRRPRVMPEEPAGPTPGERFAMALLAQPIPKAPPMRVRGER